MNEKADFYCYALLRPDGTPFYVGKGRGRRVHHHENAALRGEKGYRFNIIRKILKDGGRVGYMFYAENLTEMQANVKEVEMISTIGRRPHGPLVNLTDGGDGAAGFIHSAEHVRKRVESRLANGGFHHDAKTRAKISASRKGKGTGSRGELKNKPSPEKYARAVETKKASGIPFFTPEGVAKTVAKRRANGSYIKPPEEIARMAAKLRGRKLSAESIAKREATRRANAEQRGYHDSPEVRAKKSAAATGRKLSPELIAKRTATRRANGGYIRSAKSNAKTSATMKASLAEKA